MVALLKLPEATRRNRAMERRLFPRKEVHATIEANRLDHSIRARREPRVSLELRDVSAGGCSGVTRTAIEAGESIAVFFPPQDGRRGWSAVGRVLRSEPGQFGFRVAVEFETAPTAA
jgi:hypothetical protein